MSSSIDRAFIRAFAKQRSVEISEPQGRETPPVEQVSPAAGLVAPAEHLQTAAEHVQTPAPGAPHAARPAESAAVSAVEADSRPTIQARRVDQPQEAPAPLWQQAVVAAGAAPDGAFASVDVGAAVDDAIASATAAAAPGNEPPQSSAAPVLVSDPPSIDMLADIDTAAAEQAARVTRGLSPEQVMRRLDEPSSLVAAPHRGDELPETEQPGDAGEKPDKPQAPETGAAAAEAADTPAAPAAHADADDELPGAPGRDTDTDADADADTDADATFVPAWETDRIQWPRMADRLAGVDDSVGDAGRQLAAAAADGLRLLAVTSTYRGEGRTTVAMNLARSAAQAGARVALVDADTENPALASSAGVSAAHGWQECLHNGLPLDEAAVASLDDGVTLLPLTSAVRRAPVDTSGAAFQKLLDAVAGNFDLVVVDYGPLGANGDDGPLPGDAALLVRDIRCTSAQQAVASVRRIRGRGPQSVGVVQNFT